MTALQTDFTWAVGGFFCRYRLRYHLPPLCDGSLGLKNTLASFGPHVNQLMVGAVAQFRCLHRHAIAKAARAPVLRIAKGPRATRVGQGHDRVNGLGWLVVRTIQVMSGR